jgi:signal transduction histidine kinase
MLRVQGETLDNLTEAVTVFGSDGRLRLFNPAFGRMWKLAPGALYEHPHIEAVISWCRTLADDEAIWTRLLPNITAIENSTLANERIKRRDGIVLDCTALPLPDGATLVVFDDVTAVVNLENALRLHNEALKETEKIKTDFLHHISYELRSLLTNIIGFSHSLADPVIGQLTTRQQEYLSYIQGSANSLHTPINNILDLATVDSGAMQLNLGLVDIRATINAVASSVQHQLAQNSLALDVRAVPDIGSFVADERRVRQALLNILTNAISFSPAGETVTLSAERLKDGVMFSVTDNGPGIPSDMRDKVFDLSEVNSLSSRHHGAGLGLSLVRKFVELHGGTVTIESTLGQGTTVTCIFPSIQVPNKRVAV